MAGLKAAGCIVVGKTNTPEFGHRGETDNPVFGPSHNPWSLDHNTGGSSGGSGGAVAGGVVPLCTGSDGGGSIRIPGALCGMAGLKTSQGRVPYGGPKPPVSGFLAVRGPMALRVRDTAVALDAVRADEPSDIFGLPKDGPAWRPATRGRQPAGAGGVLAHAGIRRGGRRDGSGAGGCAGQVGGCRRRGDRAGGGVGRRSVRSVVGDVDRRPRPRPRPPARHPRLGADRRAAPHGDRARPRARHRRRLRARHRRLLHAQLRAGGGISHRPLHPHAHGARARRRGSTASRAASTANRRPAGRAALPRAST